MIDIMGVICSVVNIIFSLYNHDVYAALGWLAALCYAICYISYKARYEKK